MTYEYWVQREISKLLPEQTSHLHVYTTADEHVVMGTLADIKRPKIRTFWNKKLYKPWICFNRIVIMCNVRSALFPGQRIATTQRSRFTQTFHPFPRWAHTLFFLATDRSCANWQSETQTRSSFPNSCANRFGTLVYQKLPAFFLFCPSREISQLSLLHTGLI